MQNIVPEPSQGKTLRRRIGTTLTVLFLTLLVGSLVLALSFFHRGGSSTTSTPSLLTTQVGKAVYYSTGDGSLVKIDAVTGRALWRFQTSGRLISDPPTVVGNTAYFGAIDGNEYAVDASTGTLKWKVQLGGGAVLATPAVVGSALYTPGGDGHVYALNVSSGHQIWTYNPATSNEAITTGTLAVDNGIVYGSSSNEVSHSVLFALSANAGAPLWYTQIEGQFLTSPTVAGGVLYVSSAAINQAGKPTVTASYTYAFNPKTGSQQWRSAAIMNTAVSKPTVFNGKVYSGSTGSNLYAISTQGGSPVWQHRPTQPTSAPTGSEMNPNIAPTTSTPQIVNGVIYIGESNGTIANDSVEALNAATGKVLWQRLISNYAGADLVVVASDNVLYVGASSGTVYALNASNGGVLWTYQDAVPFSNSAIAIG